MLLSLDSLATSIVLHIKPVADMPLQGASGSHGKMAWRLRAFIGVACLATFGTSFARAQDLPHVRCAGRSLMFGWHGGAPHTVDVSSLIQAAILQTARVLAAARAGEVDYFVVSVSGPSQAWAAGSEEDKGVESNLLWLKLKSWKLLDAQSLLYESIWQGLEPIGDSHLEAGVLTLRYANTKENADYVLRYDSAKPAVKISVERTGAVK